MEHEPEPGRPSAGVGPRADRRTDRAARTCFVLYLFALTLIVFWPVHVDQGAGPLLGSITGAVPWLTYDRIEFSANVVLFVPFGLLLMWPQRRWYAAVLIALASSVFIECVQALMGGARTPDVRDVLANLIGACVGVALLVLIRRLPRLSEPWHRRPHVSRAGTSE